MLLSRRHFVLLGAGLALTLPGCAGRPKNAPVDPDLARETLRSALESWKRGDKIDALAQSSPAITIQDLDWMSGHKLLSYEIIGPGEEMDAHLFAKVKLTLRDPQGQSTTKEVTYIVSTAPARTVFRKML